MCYIGLKRNYFGLKKQKIWVVVVEINRGLFFFFVKSFKIVGIGGVVK